MSRPKTVTENCPHCNNDVELKAVIMKQFCPVCNHLIKPCAMCDPDKARCNDCPLEDEEYLNLQSLGNAYLKCRGT